MRNNASHVADFTEPPLVLASIFYHFKPDNDFAFTYNHPESAADWSIGMLIQSGTTTLCDVTQNRSYSAVFFLKGLCRVGKINSLCSSREITCLTRKLQLRIDITFVGQFSVELTHQAV
jgi:hypothetical protein